MTQRSIILTAIKLSAEGMRHAVLQMCKTKWNSVIHYRRCKGHQSWLSLFNEEGTDPNRPTSFSPLDAWVSCEGVVCCVMLHERLTGCINGTICSDSSPVGGFSAGRQLQVTAKIVTQAALFFSPALSATPQRRAPRGVQDDRPDTTSSCITSAIGYLRGGGSWGELRTGGRHCSKHFAFVGRLHRKYWILNATRIGG